jgi:uncharacterized membrane protein YgdD (TMEM256/DUF423 family)
MTGKIWLLMGSVLAGLGVALGAFGAHGLKKLVAPETVGTFQTGVQYQMYHAFALVIVGLLAERIGASGSLTGAGWCFLIGILLFSGSLYALVGLKAAQKAGLGGIGIITPVGGLFFIAGWVLLALAIAKKAA